MSAFRGTASLLVSRACMRAQQLRHSLRRTRPIDRPVGIDTLDCRFERVLCCHCSTVGTRQLHLLALRLWQQTRTNTELITLGMYTSSVSYRTDIGTSKVECNFVRGQKSFDRIALPVILPQIAMEHAHQPQRPLR